MKTKNLFARIITMGFSLSLLFFSCKKETSGSDLTAEEEEQASFISSQSDAESESIFNEIFDNVIGANNDVGLAGTGVFGRLSTSSANNATERITGCFIVTITHTVPGQDFPLLIELDFGSGCLGKDGRMRSGKIATEYSGRLTFQEKFAITSFKDYKVDSVKVEGTIKIINTSNAGFREFTVEIANASLTNTINRSRIKWSSTRVIKQIEGLATPDLHVDDVFTITGNAAGEVETPRFATTWKSTIMEPLGKRFLCSHISKGLVRISRENPSSQPQRTALLNYGTGLCDAKATLTLNGIEHQINLN